MAYCAEVVASVDGDVVRLVNPPPSTLEGCAMVVMSQADWDQVLAGSALWRLDSAQGVEIASAVVALLAVGWVMRMLARFINHEEKETT